MASEEELSSAKAPSVQDIYKYNQAAAAGYPPPPHFRFMPMDIPIRPKGTDPAQPPPPPPSGPFFYKRLTPRGAKQ